MDIVRRLAALAALVIAFVAAPALAQDSHAGDEEARLHFEIAVRAYRDGRFAEAAREFEAAYALSRRPELLHNVYLAYRDANVRDRAADALRRYLAEASDVPDRAMLEARLEALERELASAQPVDDGAAEATTEPAPPPRDDGAPILPITLIAVGGAALAGAAITTALVLSDQSELADGCPSRTECDPALRSTADRIETTALITDILLGVGLVSAGIGVALLLAGGGDSGEPGATTVACGPAGCVVSGTL